jgi:ribosomal protein L29
MFTCMSVFTKHNYGAKKLNYLTLRGKSNVNGLYFLEMVEIMKKIIANLITIVQNYYATG